jgi:cell division septation protein DedD
MTTKKAPKRLFLNFLSRITKMQKESFRTTEEEKIIFPNPFEPPEKEKKETAPPKGSFTTPHRNLPSDESPNFFDLLRIKNLSGELNRGPKSHEAPRIPLPSFVKDNRAAKRAKPQSQVRPPQRSEAAYLPEERPIVKEAPRVDPEASKPLGPGLMKSKKTAESSFVLSLKWVVKLLLSLVFLVWIFILGVLVGRGSIQQNPNLVSKSLSIPNGTMSREDFRSGPGYGLEGIEEPGTMEYPLREPDQELSGNGSKDYYSQSYPKTVPSETVAPSPPPEPLNYNPVYSSSQTNQMVPDSSYSVEPASYQSSQNSQRSFEAPQNAQPAYYQSQPPTTSPAPSPSSQKVKEVPEDDPGYWPEPPSGTGLYTVQVGSPSSEKEARSMVEKYRDKGFEAYYYSRGTRYPTRVGRFETKDAAEIARARLEKEGASGPYVSKLNP